jgi:outer membrane biosynthesis protein TonB
MRLGWLLSILAHIAAICAGLIVWPHDREPLDAGGAIVPVEVVSFSDVSNVSPIAPKDAAPAETIVEEGAPKDAAAPAEPEPAEAIADKSKPVPKKQPDKPKTLDFASLQKLIDRSRPKAGAGPNATAPNAPTGDKPRQGFGLQNGLTASIADYLASVFERCWRSPADMPNPERLIVTVRVTLNKDGTLAADPRAISAVLPGDAPMRVAADNALRAVRTCGPYKLPADSYTEWREMDLRFGVKGLIQ